MLSGSGEAAVCRKLELRPKKGEGADDGDCPCDPQPIRSRAATTCFHEGMSNTSHGTTVTTHDSRHEQDDIDIDCAILKDRNGLSACILDTRTDP